LLREAYELKHVTNPDFTDGLRGWQTQAAEPVSIRTDSFAGYGTMQGRYPRKNGIGDAFAILTRNAKAPNTISQQLQGLTPGRLYSLKLFTGDHADLQAGKVRKDPIGPADVAIVAKVLRELQPELIFVAGDLSDPHGTHRMCKEAIDKAVAEVYVGEMASKCPEIWLYRGAWQEWPVTEATVLVPLSQEELTLKIQAIFKHQSQKDSAPFPGQDEREFWQRVEQRNKTTARQLDQLGLAEYFAMEAYVVD
jgi:hypothetical protein